MYIKDGVVVIEHASYPAFHAMLKFVYTDQLPDEIKAQGTMEVNQLNYSRYDVFVSTIMFRCGGQDCGILILLVRFWFACTEVISMIIKR